MPKINNPANISANCPAVLGGVEMVLVVRSAKKAIIKIFKIVPKPNFSLNGIHASKTIMLISPIAMPNDIPV